MSQIISANVSLLFTLQKNEITFEKVECIKIPNTIVSDVSCKLKYLNREYLKLHLWTNFSKPIQDAWIHTKAYYKFNGITYRRFPIDLWDNLCDWLAKKTKSYVLDWTFGRVLQYSNMNLPCPYVGQAYLKINNISAKAFPNWTVHTIR